MNTDRLKLLAIIIDVFCINHIKQMLCVVAKYRFP